MGVISSIRVVTRAEYYGKAKLLSSGNREWVTAIECIRAYGEALPLISFSKQRVIPKAG